MFRKLFIAICILGSVGLVGSVGFIGQVGSVGSVNAEDSHRLLTYPPQKIMGFRGLDTSARTPLLQDGRAIDLQNIKLSTSFDLKQRYGYVAINESLDDFDTSSGAIHGIFDARFSGDTNFPIVFYEDKIKYDNSGTWTEIGNWWVAPTITSGKNYQFQCTMALDTAVCTNDQDVPIAISSSPAKSALDVSDLTDTLTKAKAVAWFRNYLIFGNTVEAAAEKPTRFRWSDVGTTETYDDDNFIDIAQLGGDEIIGFTEFYGNLYAFFKNAIYKITLVGGNDVFNVDKVIEGIGSIARDSIQMVRLSSNQNGVIFLSEDKKVYIFTGLGVQDIGQVIQPTLDNLNEARIQYAVSVYDGKSYYLSVSTGSDSENDTVYEYQVEIGEWTKHSDVNANAYARVRASNEILTYFGNYDGYVYEWEDVDYESDAANASAVGVVDSVTTINTKSITGGQVIIDSDITSGTYTGAIIKITSGTGAGEEQVILHNTDTSVVVATAFSTTPDSTSNYSIGAINAYYETKWYDWGDSPRKKNFKHLYFWGKEASNNAITVKYASDFGTTIESQEQSLAPSSSSVWDTAVWDQGIWTTTGDKFYRIPLKGVGRFMNIRFENSDAEETFHLYGFNILADAIDIR